MKRMLLQMTGTLLTGAIVCFSAVRAEDPANASDDASKAQQVLDQAAADQKYTFILFYKDNSTAARTMAQTVKVGLAKYPDQATLTYVQITNPDEKAIINRFGVSRAAMPMTVAVAPNGAITAIFPPKTTSQQIDNAFVTPTMMHVMKSLQDGKLVLVCVQGATETAVPPAVEEFQSDPHFKERLMTVSFEATDPAEGKFLNQMQLDPRAKATKTVLLAPPGVLVGKFDSTTTKDDIAAALAKAGKCCEDPNCKHNQQSTGRAPRTTTTQPTRGRR